MLEQFSPKKQLIIGISILIIILVSAEILSNFWWYNIFECRFENNELFADLDEETRRRLCLENIGLQITETGILPNQVGLTTNINSEGFRSPEISQYKPDKTYRIFLVGGSALFGLGLLDNQTISFFLQETFDQSDLDSKIEVVNAGIPAAGSEQEVRLIKERLISFEPDLIIVSDGVNELMTSWRAGTPTDEVQWKERWKEICQLGQDHDFKTVITLQPFVGAGKKILTENERRYLQDSHYPMQKFVQLYPVYSQQLKELNKYCTNTEDLTGIFDNEYETVYFDEFHTATTGNKIIAQKFYSISVPYILEKKEEGSSKTFVEEKNDSSNFAKKLFLNIQGFFDKSSVTINKVFLSYKTPKALLSMKTVFGNEFFGKPDLNFNAQKNIDEISEEKELTGINLSNRDLKYHDFSNRDLSNVDLSNADLSWANLTNTRLISANLTGAKLIGSILINSNLEGANLADTVLYVANLHQANLKGSNLSHADLSGANLSDTDLSDAVIFDATLHAANLNNANLTNANLNEADMFGADLQGAILNGAKLLCFNHPICD